MKNMIFKARKAELCYLCETGKAKLYFYKLGYTILRCPSCSLLTLDFHEDYNSFIHSYYQKGYFTGDKKIRAYANYAQDKPNISKNAKNILQKIKKIKSSGNILDVGCAMGFFMEVAEQQGFKVYGIEVSTYAAAFSQKLFKNRVFLGAVEDFPQKRSAVFEFKNTTFDVIILSDLIEHVKDPVSVLKDLKKVLKKDGVIVLQTGDTDSFWARLMGKNWHFYAPPQHLYFFSKNTLTKVLEKAGYKVLRVDKEGKYVSLRYILHMTQYMNIEKIGDMLFRLIANTPFGKIPILVKLFDNMVIYAAKIV